MLFESGLEAAALQMELAASPTVAQWLQRLFNPTNHLTFFSKPQIDVYVFLRECKLSSYVHILIALFFFGTLLYESTSVLTLRCGSDLPPGNHQKPHRRLLLKSD